MKDRLDLQDLSDIDAHASDIDAVVGPPDKARDGLLPRAKKVPPDLEKRGIWLICLFATLCFGSIIWLVLFGG